MTLNNEEERRAYWAGQALGILFLQHDDEESVVMKRAASMSFAIADAMEAEYRARLPERAEPPILDDAGHPVGKS